MNKVGGKTIVMNQLVDPSKRKDIDFDEQTKHFKYSDWTVTAGNKYIVVGMNNIGGHKYYIYATDKIRFSLLYIYGDSFSIALTKPNDKETEVKQIITATKSGINNLYFNRYKANPENVSYFDGCINFIDLTKMFGSGNEPSTTEEFEAMFPNDYYPYNEGELMSMSVNNVDVENANLIKPSTKFIDRNGYASKGVTYTYDTDKVITINGTFKKDDAGGIFGIMYYKDLPRYGKYTISIFDENNMLASDVKFLTSTNTSTFEYSADNGNIMIGILPTDEKTYTNKKYYLQLVQGEGKKTYSPYTMKNYTIPQAIQNLDGYGWGVNNVYNYVDFENKKFYKCVGRVDLGALDYSYATYQNNEGPNVFRTSLINDMKKDENAHLHDNNLLCYKYAEMSWSSLWVSKIDKTISQSSGAINIMDSAFTDVEAFKKSLQGVYLYYELAEPVVTDISDIIGDTFQEPIDVESGGSLTFKNTNGDGYKVAVPSDIQYVVSLKEVTS